MKTLLRVVFFTLTLGLGMAFTSTVNAQNQQTAKLPVDEMPVPPGGMTGFTNYMIQTLSYPTAAKEANVQGMVVVTFVVTAAGKVENVEVLRGIGSGCDEEAVRVISNSGIWTPGKNGGNAVDVKMTLPVQFKL